MAIVTPVVSSPDGSEKPGAKKTNFSSEKTATSGSSFYGLEK
jgi:hypothetical protein